MHLVEFKDEIPVFVGFLLSIVGALIGAKIQRVIDKRTERRPLNQLLNLGNDQLLFVFPHRDQLGGAILPRTSTEDFLAMNNFMSCLLNLEWNKKIGVRDTRHVSASPCQ